MQNRLIIISDLWGTPKSDWLQLYIPVLEPYFDIKYYDSSKLAGLDTIDYTQENLHQQFVKGGIDRAVQRLSKLETGRLTILAFSIGGMIGWKAGLLGLSIDNFYAISATRLRYEKTTLNTNIYLFYGQKDPYQPNKEWFNLHHLNKNTFSNETHECYKKLNCAQAICKTIIGNKKDL